jgi:septum formation protein
MRIILASQSQRRYAILKEAGVDFETIPSTFDESKIVPTIKEEYVMELSYHKAYEVFLKHQEAIVIGADTIVYIKDEPNEYYLGKPKDTAHAKEMLKMLSGRTHQVLTGVTVIKKNSIETFYTQSNVTFKQLSELDINDYLKTNEPFDKAGSYGIQGEGRKLIESFDGDFYTIMGLPIKEVMESLYKIKTSYK